MLSHYPFIGGMIIGLILALPTGPGAFMVIKQGIKKPMLQVFLIALVCIASDTLWNIFLCSAGDVSKMLVDVLLTHKDTIKTWAGPIFIFLGGYIFISEMLAMDSSATGIKKTFFVSMVNPLIPLTLATLIVYVVGGTYFTSTLHYQFRVITGVFLGEIITWWFGIIVFHQLMLQGLNDRAIPYIFGILFIASGALLWIRGYYFT